MPPIPPPYADPYVWTIPAAETITDIELNVIAAGDDRAL